MRWRHGRPRRTCGGVGNLLSGINETNSLLLLVSTIFIRIVHGTFLANVGAACH